MPEPNPISAVAERVEGLLNAFNDPSDRLKAQELVRGLMELYGTALGNVLQIVRQSGEGAEWMLERFGEDKLVASLLLVHGLHPLDCDTRIRRALAHIDRYLGTHRLVLEAVADGAAKVRVEAAGDNNLSHPPSGLAAAIDQAVRQAAPEVDRVEVEGLAQPTALVQIAIAQGR